MRKHCAERGIILMLLAAGYPTVLYHVTQKKFLPRIRREGLKPHVPGKVFGVCDPETTRGKRVVWLTADPTQWRHDKHHRESMRDPDAKLLRVVVSWHDERLYHYLSWRDPKKKELEPWSCPNNLLGWFVYFGRIRPQQIMFPQPRAA